MKGHFRLYRSEDYDKLLEFYSRIDCDYYPRLSERPGGIEGHILEVLNSCGNFALFEVNDDIEGAAGFFPFDQEKTTIKFTIFSFTKEYRKSLIPYRMVKYLISLRDPLGYSNVERIIARTWYEESAKRLERLGFNHVATIRGDVVPERTSYYFEGYINSIMKRVSR